MVFASAQDESVYVAAVEKMSVPEFRPVDGVKIATTEAEAKEQGTGGGGGQLEDVDAQCERMLNALPKPADMKDFRWGVLGGCSLVCQCSQHESLSVIEVENCVARIRVLRACECALSVVCYG